MARTWYYVDENDVEIGPVDSKTIRARVADGTITRQTMIWRDDLPDWINAGRMRKLFAADSGGSSRARPSDSSSRTSTSSGQPRRVERPVVDLSDEEDDWSALAEEPIADDDPYAFHDDSGRALRSFSRPAPKPVIQEEQEENPYAVGTSGRHVRASRGAAGDFAGPLQRLGARFIDGLIFTVGYAAFFGIGIVLFDGQNGGQPDQTLMVAWLGALVFYVLGFFYVLIPLQNASEHQASWGKRVVGIIVTDTDGQRIGFGQSVGRELAQALFGIVPFLPLINVIWYFVDDSKQTLHDKLAKTLVMKSG